MAFDGTGQFDIDTAGQPVVAGTDIDAVAHNLLTADLATGLSTCIAKDGQTTTTALIPFAFGISTALVTNSTGLAHGTWNPTAVAVTNVDGSPSATGCIYARVGNTVHFSGTLTVDPTTAAGTATEVGIPLPIASNFGTVADCSGTVSGHVILETGRLLADATNDRISLQFAAQSAASHTVGFSGNYTVI